MLTRARYLGGNRGSRVDTTSREVMGKDLSELTLERKRKRCMFRQCPQG